MRRLAFMCVLVGVLAGCSSGSSNVASSKTTAAPTKSSSASPTGTSSTSAKAKTSPTTTKGAKPKPATTQKAVIGGATNFCGAFKELRTATAAGNAATASAVYIAAAADMRQYAPAAIKGQVSSYASVIEAAGKALKAGTMPSTASVKPGDLAAVTIWVGKNCPKK